MTSSAFLYGGDGRARGYITRLFDDGFEFVDLDGSVILSRRYPGLAIIEQPLMSEFVLGQINEWAGALDDRM